MAKPCLLAAAMALTVGLAACGPGRPPASPTAAATRAAASTRPATNTAAPPSAPTPVAPTAVPTQAPTLAPPTPAPGADAPLVECPTGDPWSQTQGGTTLSICFDPHPPKLGTPGRYTVLLIDAAGQPMAEAQVELTMVGGMAGMEGEHDEDFALEMASQGAGLYAAEGPVGPSDLELTGIIVRVRSGGDVWTFNLPASALARDG